MVSLDELTTWRKDGLLPPLANAGLGTGKGKSYYWREENILARAQTVCDAMRQHGRPDQVLVTLFLSGFKVPLTQLRRAWLHRGKLRKSLKVRTAAGSEPSDLPHFMPALPDMLQQIMVCVGDAISGDNVPGALAVLDRGLARLGHDKRARNSDTTGRFWCLASVIASALESSNLLSEASDEEIHEAQRHLGTITELLADCCESERPADVIEALGPPLFVFVLTLLHSGHVAMLEAILARVSVVRPVGAMPLAESLYAQA
jgi:alkylhydroperoxidase/carboxymuconolactone decarboxylase family protein YurZ